ncbi:VanZ family protein [Desulfallas thermosapovorans]|uniref:VanZ family protein n=1 Tax=Desulfallas thermosapovorans DSM 6562 TaxID=1121431 RepID=A0A5S4ZPG9_9FIRM|nr:VanZ family protein [Desulfallas thermosapovorans]TYO92008.1 VanZ family protein [Desulfallas thermosapovorans DSM 6562]
MYKFLSWITVILWMVLIFNLSSQVAEQSNELSTGITEVIVKTVEKVAPMAEFDIKSFNNVLRKNAHFFAYLVLGILLLNALRRSGVNGYRSFALTLGFCVLYAVSDEVHQLFVSGRGGQVKDVIIDSAGVSVGIGVFWAVGKLVMRSKIRDKE